MRLGYFLSSEEHGPGDLVALAGRAEEAGFQGLWISDHYHPWIDEQGHSPFVWSVIGAIAQATEAMALTTAVTCPTIRIHPAVIAHAAATSAVMLPGRFRLGVGSGEALNEHILGGPWPSANVRLEMLEEAIEVIRLLWRGGQQEHEGKHYRVENARLYDLPEHPPPIYVSGFGPKATRVAARTGDGYCVTFADEELIGLFRQEGGRGKTVQAGVKVCWGPDEGRARSIAHRLWPNEVLPGELAQILPTPAHFEQAVTLVGEDQVAEAIVCGPDLERHAAKLQEFADAGVDELYVQQVGPDQDGFFEAYAAEVLPRFA
ncbi:MAG TPA: TIGR03557 family F420-dependent LLM class oxidoreductase [Solirubrobacteraceae bacterium]|nr:TIGR03557 family F420-dependent LLM class oxidoreductase [Solirubrobacteraceae bacterium]